MPLAPRAPAHMLASRAHARVWAHLLASRAPAPVWAHMLAPRAHADGSRMLEHTPQFSQFSLF